MRELDDLHTSPAHSTLLQRTGVHRRPSRRASAQGTKRYGLLLDYLKPAVVNGFIYMQPVAYLAPEGAMKPPPRVVLWLLTRLHPKMRARISVSARAFERRQWRDDLELWDSQDKPAAIERHQAIQMVDVQALDDGALVAHLARCHAHIAQMIELHHKYTVTSTVATGEFLAETMGWTGASAGEVCNLLKGSSPISNGFAADELVKAGHAIAADPDAAAQLHSSAAATDKLAALSENPDVGPAVRAYLETVRHRSVGYDVGDASAGEMPDLLVEALLSAADHTESHVFDSTALDDVRSKVPAAHLAQFDQCLTEARLMNRLRDERGVYADGWATGLARRALLEVGRRLHERGLLLDPEHAVDLTIGELTSLVRGRGGPSPTDAAEHYRWRTTKTIADAPPFLNALPAPPPPTEVLPAAARRGARAMNTLMSNLFAVSEEPNSETVLHGLSVNDGTYEGTARLVQDAADFGRIRQGDVLVTRSTSPYFNVVLPLLGAIVTDRGGQLSHAAIVAREYGIPGVVGTREATTVVPDGARVLVDGTTGEVRLLSGP